MLRFRNFILIFLYLKTKLSQSFDNLMNWRRNKLKYWITIYLNVRFCLNIENWKHPIPNDWMSSHVNLTKLPSIPFSTFSQLIRIYSSRSARLCSCQKPITCINSCSITPSLRHPSPSETICAPPILPTWDAHPVPGNMDK